MNFETVLFAAAFLILAAISIPENQEPEGEPETVSALTIQAPDVGSTFRPDADLTPAALQAVSNQTSKQPS